MSAIDDLRFLENRFRGILELLPTLEGVASVENHLKELRAKKDWLVKEVSKSQAEVDAVVASAQKDLETKVASIKAAEAEAKSIVDKAKAQADVIIAKAVKDADSVKKEASEEVANFNTLIDTKTKEVSLLGDEVSKKTAEYTEITAKLAALKAKL